LLIEDLENAHPQEDKELIEENDLLEEIREEDD
jgi:hypothetical protein